MMQKGPCPGGGPRRASPHSLQLGLLARDSSSRVFKRVICCQAVVERHRELGARRPSLTLSSKGIKLVTLCGSLSAHSSGVCALISCFLLKSRGEEPGFCSSPRPLNPYLSFCPSSSDPPHTGREPGTGCGGGVSTPVLPHLFLPRVGAPPDLSFSAREMGWLWEGGGLVVSTETPASASGDRGAKEGISEE